MCLAKVTQKHWKNYDKRRWNWRGRGARRMLRILISPRRKIRGIVKSRKKEKDNTDGKSNPPQNKHDKNEKEMSEQAQRKLSTTTLDLTSAAKRRETSDKYFAAVKSGVAEVVRKLDGVADAMREVEMQSRDIWGDGDGKGSDGSSGFGSLSS